MLGAENFVTVSGITLSRKILGENNLRVTLFLRDIGLISIGSKNFGGASEPLICGKFRLQKHKRLRSYFVYDIEVADDMLKLRFRREALQTVMAWKKLLFRYLNFEQPDNSLLANLYWSMKLLCFDHVPVKAVNWKFIWKWIENWGVAPELLNFYAEKNFNSDELYLLAQIIILNNDGIAKLFTEKISTKIRRNFFDTALKLALTFLETKS